MGKTIISETMKCLVCSNIKWEIKNNKTGVGIAIIILGWLLGISSCSQLITSGIGPGFFGMNGIGLISFFVILFIAHQVAKSYKKRKYECTKCGHIMSGE